MYPHRDYLHRQEMQRLYHSQETVMNAINAAVADPSPANMTALSTTAAQFGVTNIGDKFAAAVEAKQLREQLAEEKPLRERRDKLREEIDAITGSINSVEAAAVAQISNASRRDMSSNDLDNIATGASRTMRKQVDGRLHEIDNELHEISLKLRELDFVREKLRRAEDRACVAGVDITAGSPGMASMTFGGQFITKSFDYPVADPPRTLTLKVRTPEEQKAEAKALADEQATRTIDAIVGRIVKRVTAA